jgi:hypothetical protein
VRSLWEGFDKVIGTTKQLGSFYSIAAKACPCMALDYHLLDWIGHKKYLLCLEAQGVPIIPTVMCHFNVSSPGEVKRAMESKGWPHAILKPAVGMRLVSLIVYAEELSLYFFIILRSRYTLRGGAKIIT